MSFNIIVFKHSLGKVEVYETIEIKKRWLEK